MRPPPPPPAFGRLPAPPSAAMLPEPDKPPTLNKMLPPALPPLFVLEGLEDAAKPLAEMSPLRTSGPETVMRRIPPPPDPATTKVPPPRLPGEDGLEAES